MAGQNGLKSTKIWAIITLIQNAKYYQGCSSTEGATKTCSSVCRADLTSSAAWHNSVYQTSLWSRF